MSEYTDVVDHYDGKTYSGLVVLSLEGMRNYNSRFNRTDIWVIMHSKWYVTVGNDPIEKYL